MRERKKSEAQSYCWQSPLLVVLWHQAGEMLETIKLFSQFIAVVVASNHQN